LCCCITDTSVLRQSAKSIWKPWLRFRPGNQVHADTQKGRLLLAPVFAGCHGCAATAPLQSKPNTPSSLLPAAPMTWSAGVLLVFLMDGCAVCCLHNPLQSPFSSSPGCCFIFSSTKGDQIENENVVLGKER